MCYNVFGDNMSIDGRFINKLSKELDSELNNGRIQRISQLSKSDFLMSIRVNNTNQKLYISLSTSLSRINLTDRKYNSDYIPGGFCMFLRKHLERGIILKISQLNHDRIIQMELENHNDLGDSVKLYLVMEMFSRYTNLIILNEDYKIINAYKHISPFDNLDRAIANGILYEVPEDHKLSPDDFEGIQSLFSKDISAKEIVDNIRGISPLLANYLCKEANYNNKNLFEIYQKIYYKAPNPTISFDHRTEFYYLDIFSKNKKHYENLSSLINAFYEEASGVERIKQIYKYLFNFVKRENKRKKHKLEKLSVDLNKANEHDLLRITGDTLMANLRNFYKGDATYKGYSYELNKEIDIELDRMLSPVQNANKYYTKYKKQKTAVNYIKQQIQITKEQVIYFDDLMTQIQNTQSFNDLLEIQNELISHHFMPKRKKIENKKKPNYDTYYDELGIMILVGKNNIQNNYITHKFAKKDYWWFHTKNLTGSHVVVCDVGELEETTIRTAANLSAYYSKARSSSSVPVDYTRVKYLKKVPGKLGSYVTLTNQKTIYIDPEEEIILQLKRK